MCVQWSGDNKYVACPCVLYLDRGNSAVPTHLACRYIVSGSDETNLRLWKATAWEQLGTKSARQRTTQAYQEKLKEKFKHHPEVAKIMRYV